MALNPRYSNLAVNTGLNALIALLNNGWFDIYDGTQPGSADVPPPAGANLLASLRFGSPAFGPSMGGVATANAIAREESAARTGVAAWYRLTRADHSTVMHDGSVGLIDTNLVLSNVNITLGGRVSVGSFVLSLLKF